MLSGRNRTSRTKPSAFAMASLTSLCPRSTSLTYGAEKPLLRAHHHQLPSSRSAQNTRAS